MLIASTLVEAQETSLSRFSNILYNWASSCNAFWLAIDAGLHLGCIEAMVA